ncbi:hypothetical protein [Parabacteroides leei]|uniref:hypothetical protein n=1 Tax=Parabacteroides leei TaxID=2939491 RepID=UPI0018971BC1|nr:hypothetical protein [Parabacteroides goldsteinii]
MNSINNKHLINLHLSSNVGNKTRLRLLVYDGCGDKRSLIGISNLPEENAIEFFLNPKNSKDLQIMEAVPVPFYLAYIVSADGELIDDCIIEQPEDPIFMLEDFYKNHPDQYTGAEFLLVYAIEFRGIRSIVEVRKIDNQYLNDMGVAV